MNISKKIIESAKSLREDDDFFVEGFPKEFVVLEPFDFEYLRGGESYRIFDVDPYDDNNLFKSGEIFRLAFVNHGTGYYNNYLGRRIDPDFDISIIQELKTNGYIDY